MWVGRRRRESSVAQLVEGRSACEDRRIKRVFLTETGRQGNRIWDDMLSTEEVLLNGLTDTERKILLLLLENVLPAIGAMVMVPIYKPCGHVLHRPDAR